MKSMALNRKQKGNLYGSQKKKKTSVALFNLIYECAHRATQNFLHSAYVEMTVKAPPMLILNYKFILASRQIHKYATRKMRTTICLSVLLKIQI